MNENRPGDPADTVARVALHHRRVHRAVVARIWELFDGGLNDAEVARVTGYPVHLVRVVLRGGNAGCNIPQGEIRTKPHRPSQPVCAKSTRRERD